MRKFRAMESERSKYRLQDIGVRCNAGRPEFTRAGRFSDVRASLLAWRYFTSSISPGRQVLSNQGSSGP